MRSRASILAVGLWVCGCSAAGQPAAAGDERKVSSGVTRIEITRREPAFGGVSFGDVGSYDKIVGRYWAALDPADPYNQPITDLELAPRNADGMVEYSADFYILRPSDAAKGNATMLYEIGNRGRKDSMYLFNYAAILPVDNDLTNPADGFLMRQGYILAWSGVYGDVAESDSGGDSLTIALPVAKHPDGTTIEETIWDECNFSAYRDGGTSCALSYPVPSLDKNDATLVVRERRADPPSEVPRSQWAFSGNDAIRLVPLGTAFAPGLIYQFIHKAQDPPVMGIGLAAMRDWMTFLRDDPEDKDGNANPVYGEFQRTLAVGLSQSARMAREFLYRGFNEASAEQKTFDGVLLIGASTRPFVNFRFAQPGRATDKQHQDLFYPNSGFPFAFEDQQDPLTGQTDGILHQCAATETCPKIFHVSTSTEYWQFAVSVVTSDATGTVDAVLPDNVRAYLFAGMPHSTSTMAEPGMTQHEPNPSRYTYLLRALLSRLNEWVALGQEPPASRVPRISDGTLVPTDEVVWPSLPATTFAGPVANRQRTYDYGTAFAGGLISAVLPGFPTHEYPVLVPQVDADGNDLGGVRHPIVAVPLATRTGWGVRTCCGAAGELHPQYGSIIPFAPTAAARVAASDPRLAVAERYTGVDDYNLHVVAATQLLVEQGFVLGADLDAVVSEAMASW
jgi:hypothetical protein